MAEFLRVRAARIVHQSVSQPSNGVERLIGWSLAIWVHPVAAWHLQSGRARAVLVAGYFTASYLGALAVLWSAGL